MGSAVFSDWKIAKGQIETVQVNLGNRCNQSCTHCHVEGSPAGDRNMDSATAEKVLAKLLGSDIMSIEFTGGAPEMNPSLALFIVQLSTAARRVTVRTNLTVLTMPEHARYIELYRKHGVRLIASLPAVFKETTDRQRGAGVFERSIAALKQLNAAGYGADSLSLDLVYNPSGDFLPPPEAEVESEYRSLLKDRHGVWFNRLFTMVNAPLARYKDRLEQEGAYDRYLELLKRHHNPATLDRVMCRNLVSVDYQGCLYDCDFNLAAQRRIPGYEERRFWEIDLDQFHPEIACAEYCYACTVGSGSSCHGALVKSDAGEAPSDFDVKETVQQYYGEELMQSADLKTSACCTLDAMPAHIRQVMPFVHDEIKMKYYGCGNVVPDHIRGLTILDMGCGTGRDSYVMAYLAGEQGFVHGIDMTKAQIDVAKRYEAEQAERFGFSRPNTSFIHDAMENVGQHVPARSVDLVTSNCVINLVEDKERVLRSIFDVLKDGGEFYFSDVYADRRLPEPLRTNRVLYGECLGGALYWKDFERMARRAGFTDPRIVSKRAIEITDEAVKALVGNITFYSVTYRLWKIEGLEDACEDYGHVAVYKGGVPESPFRFILDDGHVFERNRPERVCGNTAFMLSRTRFGSFFEITGSFDEHFGLFQGCSTTAAELMKQEQDKGRSGPSCC